MDACGPAVLVADPVAEVPPIELHAVSPPRGGVLVRQVVELLPHAGLVPKEHVLLVLQVADLVLLHDGSGRDGDRTDP